VLVIITNMIVRLVVVRATEYFGPVTGWATARGFAGLVRQWKVEWDVRDDPPSKE